MKEETFLNTCKVLYLCFLMKNTSLLKHTLSLRHFGYTTLPKPWFRTMTMSRPVVSCVLTRYEYINYCIIIFLKARLRVRIYRLFWAAMSLHRKSYTIQHKLQVLKWHHTNGGNGHATANHFGLDRKVVRSWLKRCF